MDNPNNIFRELRFSQVRFVGLNSSKYTTISINYHPAHLIANLKPGGGEG